MFIAQKRPVGTVTFECLPKMEKQNVLVNLFQQKQYYDILFLIPNWTNHTLSNGTVEIN